ncbi:MAG: Ig-like domain-containing protein [Thermoanaerobaculia bacterium]
MNTTLPCLRRGAALCVLAASAMLLGSQVACDSGSPTAPTGTVLTVTASPTRISLDGTSQITVIGRRPDGNPLNRGTEIRLTTSLGTIDAIVEVDGDGVATATLRGDGRNGTATVEATTGDGSATASTDVQIGESSDTQPELLVNVSPDNIPVQGTAEVTITAREPDGTPVEANRTVILTTTLGSLDPERPVTDSDGTARSTLQGGDQSGTATITAILGSSPEATAQVTIRDAATDISLQANPQTIPDAANSITLTAFVTNAQGQGFQGAPVTFRSQRGTLETTGVVFTNSNGVAENTLSVTEGQISSGDTFDVTAETPDGEGNLIGATIVITVQS